LLLAVDHHKAGRAQQVEKLTLEVLASDTQNAHALLLLGLACRQQGRIQASINMIRRAQKARPSDPLVLANLGLALMDQQNNAEAEQLFLRTLEVNPRQVEALFGMGGIFFQKNDLDEAEKWLRQTLEVEPEYADALNNLAVVVKKKGNREEALRLFRKAVELAPSNIAFLCNLGENLHESGKYPEAVATLKRVLEVEPDNVKAKQVLCFACYDLGDLEASKAYCHSALAQDPEHIVTRFNLCMIKLLEGDYESGWPEYDLRWKVYPPRKFTQPQWMGESLEGKRLLIHAEQGLGDTMQFIRYLELAQGTGAEIHLEVPERLYRLIETIKGPAKLYKNGEPLPEFDYHSPLLSLPARFHTTLQTVPARIPYLRTPAEAREKAAKIAWPQAGLRVGLSWGGSPGRNNDVLRSFQLSYLEPLFDLEGVNFFSLQMGPPAAQLEPYKDKIFDLAPFTGDMADTAAQIEELDLVISVDTSIAHLTGGLGKPLWVMLSLLPDWRWMLNRSDSVWYPTARLFRQIRWNDWSTVVQDLRQALAEKVAQISR
jgi:tetratricopeptide (TPR) repeat protein